MRAPNIAAPTGLAVMPQVLQLPFVAHQITCWMATPISAPEATAIMVFIMCHLPMFLPITFCLLQPFRQPS